MGLLTAGLELALQEFKASPFLDFRPNRVTTPLIAADCF
jgi:hypothetical protein